MTFPARLAVGLYGGLLRLYPRKFQQEFREEMLGVFANAVTAARRTGALALLQLLFFELLDLPFNLAIEHFSQWRKVWSMKDTRHGIRPFRSAAMGALGLAVGLLLVTWGNQYLDLLVLKAWPAAEAGSLHTLRALIPSAVTGALVGALLGWMLCLSVSAGARLSLRTCLWMAGFGAVAALIGAAMVNFSPYQRFFDQFYDGNWQAAALVLEAALWAMIDGLFTGAALGLAAGGWKSGWRFALKGMVVYGLGTAIGESLYVLWKSSGYWIGNTTAPVSVITLCIGGILAGGLLGWLWGREMGSGPARVLQANPGNPA